jgi:uroporphyrinogen-III decarboxylase
MEMTSKERILAAMNLQRPDRVPLMCQFSIGCMMEQLHPDPVAFWYDQQTFADGLIELRERFRFDGILVSLHGHSDDWKRDLLSREELGEGSVRLEYPDRTELHCWQDLPVVTFRSPRKSLDLESVDVERDISGQLDYIPVSHNLYFRLDPENLYGIFDYLYSRVGDSCSIHGEITSPLDYYLDLFGYEQGLMGLIMYPAKAAQILQRFTDGVKRIARGMCRMPVDAIKISSPFAGRGFISSEFYEQFVLPYESQIIREIRQAGKFVYIHTCGSIGDRLELMQRSGASGLECLDPVPVGDVDLEDAFRRIGREMFIKGNIDSINTLLMADDAKAEEDVRRIIRTGMTLGRGFILSTACSIAPLVPRRRIEMLHELVMRCGQYGDETEQR